MLAEPLPRFLDLRKLTNREAQICGDTTLGQLPRLAHVAGDGAEPVHVSLRFFRDEEGHYRISGQVDTRVLLTCQRCLRSFSQPLHSRPELVVVWSDVAAEQLPAEVDPWLATDEPVELVAMLEEEILLALPLVALHEDCHLPAVSVESVPVNDSDDDKVNPFSVLAELKKKQD